MNPMEHVLQQKQILSIRRNHAVEHATLNILARRYPQYSLSGYSDTAGFFVFGNVPENDLFTAAEEAVRRMNDGENNLAIHPYCGTNYVTMGAAAGLAAWLGMLGVKNNWRDKFDRLSLVITLSTLALIVAQPLGPKVQRNITTTASMGPLKIMGIEKVSRGKRPIFRIRTNPI